jgi:hypothetical protein
MAIIKKTEIITQIFSDKSLAVVQINSKMTPKKWGEAKYLFDKSNGNLNIDPDYYKTISWDEWDTFAKEMQFDDELWMYILESEDHYIDFTQGFAIVRNRKPIVIFDITAE